MRYAILILGVLALTAKHHAGAPIRSAPGMLPGPPIEIQLGDTGGNFGGELRLPPRFEETARLLPGLRRLETRRFLLLSDLDEPDMVAHGRLLERTAHAVEAFRDRLGLQGIELPHKMLAVAFAERSDFLAFALEHDTIHADWMAGYFSPVSARLVYFHARDIPSARIAARRIDRLADDGADAEDARQTLQAFIDQSTSAVVVHEAVHMILHVRGIMPAESVIPLWLAEGLAAAFEPRGPLRPFGPFQPTGGRSDAFRADLAEDRVPPLELLVCSVVLPQGGAESVRRFYDASAAFCSWLVRTEPVEFARYIESARAGEVIGSAHSRRRSFERVFGPIKELEARWLASERSRIDW